MLAVVSMAFQILPHQLSIASNEVDLGRIFCVQLQLNCVKQIVFLKKQRRTLAANHLMKTTFLSFCSQFTDFTEGLNTLRCFRSECLAIGTPDFRKLYKYYPLAKMMPHMCTFNIRHPVLLSDVIIIIVTTVMHIKQLVTRTKHSKYTFATLLKHCLPRNWIHYIFG